MAPPAEENLRCPEAELAEEVATRHVVILQDVLSPTSGAQKDKA